MLDEKLWDCEVPITYLVRQYKSHLIILILDHKVANRIHSDHIDTHLA